MKDEIKEILDRLERIDHKEYIAFEFADSATFNEMARCFEERKKMADYITNLQEENEKLKEDNYELQKYINEEEGFVKDENRELSLRIDKAVEYNNKNIHSQTLNNILQGSDKDE